MKTVIIGSGNVATILGKALSKVGFDIMQVWSRNIRHAEELASVLQSQSIDDLTQIDSTANLYVIAVSDDSIQRILSQIEPYDGIVVHTSGSTTLRSEERRVGKEGVGTCRS